MAGRACSICEHKKRNEIDKSLSVDGASIRSISRQYGVSKDALSRHVKNGHVIAKIKQAVKAQEVAEADDLLKEVQETEKITRYIISHALKQKKKMKVEDDAGKVTVMEFDAPDMDIALKALARREKQIELKGRVLGSFKDPQKGDQTQVNVAVITHEYRLVKGVDPPVRK